MPLKVYKPTTAGRRHTSVDTFEDITKHRPEKSLLKAKKRTSGRSAGKITVRHRGGGEKRQIRIIDFRGDKFDVPATVTAIEYDPNRGARIALLRYADGEKRYMIAPLALGINETVLSSLSRIEPKLGNRMPMAFIPVGLMVHNIELQKGQGGKLARGAGAGAQLLSLEGGYVSLKLPSGEVRKFPDMCRATVGQVGNVDRHLIRWGKAGRMRHRGIRPHVRGKAMNPIDHPHGGGEGHNPIGLIHPKTAWGRPAFGVKTRNRKKWSNQFIIERRK